jgi:indolepyruvate ferredoxin oxidoreductase
VADPTEHSTATTVRLAGVGGTGVVTAAQLVATAAMLDGFEVRGLDQTGLSQKAGPVFSDLVIGPVGGDHRGNHLGAGQADALLALDPIVAAADASLVAAAPGRTRLVGSSSLTPTVAMVLHPEREADPPGRTRARVEQACRPGAIWVDADAVARRLVGHPATANLVVVGAAVQAGVLPVTPASMATAIELNGVAARANEAAFTWGRVAAADPAALERALAEHTAAPIEADTFEFPPDVQRHLGQLARANASAEFVSALALRSRDLMAFDGPELANEYLDHVARTARAEQRAREGSWALTETVALELYRVMAYKDEYEVARLLLDPATLADAADLFDGPTRISWQLHPPLLRALGRKRKIAIGTRAAPGLALLAKGKRLRGTPWDPFGHTRVRRAERKLAADYRRAIDELIDDLTAERIDRAIEIASLPAGVRGYEHRKLEAMKRVDATLPAALADYHRIENALMSKGEDQP